MVNLKLISVKQIAENQFEVITSKNDIPRTDILTRQTAQIGGIKEELVLYNSEDLTFGEIWGSPSFGLGREIGPKIRELVEASNRESA